VKKINIKSCFISRFGVRDLDYLAITMEAVRPLLTANDEDRVAHVYLASYAAAELCHIEDPFHTLIQEIRSEFPRLRAEYHGLYKTGGEALHDALTNMSATGSRGDVLVVGSEKMTHLDPAVVAGVLAARENQHDRRYGATLPALGALVTRSYMERFGVPETALHRVAIKNHRHGSRNPNAHFRREITLEEVASSPLVADPLRRLHCAPISDGAAAVLLSGDPGDVGFAGWGRGIDTPLFQERGNIARFVGTARAAHTALERAAVTPGDIDVIEIHDAFSSFEMINLEEMGFYPLGSSWRALEDGDLNIGGKLAVNSSGGMKAKGHPIGATGLSSIVELHEQLTGRAGPRQHGNPRLGIIQSVGGVAKESYVFVVETR
jgi:acetyl-CoA C-acetyltransferase